MAPDPGQPLVTRLRIEAEGSDLIECAGELDRATNFVLRRHVPAHRNHVATMTAGVVTLSSGGNTMTALDGETLFAASHKFIEDVYESKITGNGTVYYIGRRVIALDEFENELRGPMDGMPSVPSVPFALEVDGRTRAIAVSATAGPADIFDAIVAAPWFKPLPDTSRYQLQAFYDGSIRTLYEAPLAPTLDDSVLLTPWKAEDLAEMQPLYFCPSEVIARAIIGSPVEYDGGVLFSPPRPDRQGDGVAVEAIVSGQRTNVWVDPGCTVWQAGVYAAKAQGIHDITSVWPDGRGWAVRDRIGNVLAMQTPPADGHRLISEVGPELFPLYVSPPAGVGG